MWDFIVGLFKDINGWELLLIFCSRIVEVSAGTIRIILINKGYRKPAFLLAFLEVMIWIFVASSVIGDITEKPIKAIVYSFGFASGVYVGSYLENMIAVGKVLIQVITSPDKGMMISEALRTSGYGVTTMKATGKDAEKMVLMVYANRKGKEIIFNKVQGIDEHAMIVSNDVSTLKGGYINSWRRFVK